MNPAELISWLLMLCLLATSGTAWVLAFRRRSSGEPLLRYEPRQHVPWGALDLLLFLCLFIAFIVVAGAVLALSGSTEFTLPLEKQSAVGRALTIFFSAASEFALVIAALLLIAFKNSASRSDLGIVVDRAGEDLRLGMVGFIYLAGPVFLIQAILSLWWPSEHPLIELVRKNPSLSFFLVSIFSAVIVAPIAEELVFRVLLQGWLEKFQSSSKDPEGLLLGRFPSVQRDAQVVDAKAVASDEVEMSNHEYQQAVDNNPYASPQATSTPNANAECKDAMRREAAGFRPPIWPIMVSAAVFALMHYNHGPDPIPLFVFAIGLGYLYQRTHRVLPCIVVHFLLNSLSMGILILEAYFGGQSW